MELTVEIGENGERIRLANVVEEQEGLITSEGRKSAIGRGHEPEMLAKGHRASYRSRSEMIRDDA